MGVTAAGGIQTQQAATQDALRLLGRAGGTGTYIGTITPTTLSASRTYTMPDASIVVSGSASALTAGRLPGVTTEGLLADTDISVGLADGVISRAGEIRLSATGANIITVYTNGSERARFLSGGALLIGTTAAVGSELFRNNGSTVLGDITIGQADGIISRSTAGCSFAQILTAYSPDSISFKISRTASGTNTNTTMQVLQTAGSWFFGGTSANSFAWKWNSSDISTAPHMVLTNAGALSTLVSVAAPLGDFNQASSTGAAAPVKLTQADVDQPFLRFVGTAAASTIDRSIVKAADASAVIAGYVKIFVEDLGDQMTDQSYYIPVYTLS
jgi:hypothetical protein